MEWAKIVWKTCRTSNLNNYPHIYISRSKMQGILSPESEWGRCDVVALGKCHRCRFGLREEKVGCM